MKTYLIQEEYKEYVSLPRVSAIIQTTKIKLPMDRMTPVPL